ncbi:hypothetical protein VTN02DRAFT_1508 [Thermoascus thermophilus]
MPEKPDVEANEPETRAPSGKMATLWNEVVDPIHAEFVFLTCCLITGLCDGSAYNAWSCFISMQTGHNIGNTIFLGLGASNLPHGKAFGWLKSLVSICSFFVGAFSFSATTRRLGPRRRGTLFGTFLAQGALIVVAAGLIQGDVIPHRAPDDAALTGGRLFLELIPLALLAFQFGGQMAASRMMGFNEIPTLVLTSVYFDLASDPALTDGVTRNVKRNRRVGAVTAILVGAIAAGWLSRSEAEMQSALWISAFLKFCIAVGWWFWWPEGSK